MATVTITNLTNNRIGVPAPINRVLTGNQTIVVDLVDDAEMSTADKISSLVSSGLILVSIAEDSDIEDALELQAAIDAAEAAAAAAIPGGWADITTVATLNTGWTSSAGGGGDWYPLQFRIMPDTTTVELRGGVYSTGAVSYPIFTLPESMRPGSDSQFTAHDSGAQAYVSFDVRGPGGSYGEVEPSVTQAHPVLFNLDGAKYYIS